MSEWAVAGSAPRTSFRVGYQKTRAEGFTLIELLVATALSAVLMSAVLTILAALSRDRVRLDQATAVASPAPVIERLRWDVRNATSMKRETAGLVLTGHGGIDRQTLTPTGRFTRVTYRLLDDRSVRVLVREQEYLDDRVRPERWREIVAVGVKEFVVAADREQIQDADGGSVDSSHSDSATSAIMPSRIRVHVDIMSTVADEVIVAR